MMTRKLVKIKAAVAKDSVAKGLCDLVVFPAPSFRREPDLGLQRDAMRPSRWKVAFQRRTGAFAKSSDL